MTDSHGLSETSLFDDVRDIVGVGSDGVRAVRFFALAMPSQVDGYHPMPPCKMLGLRGKERAIASPTVHEDKGRLAYAAILEG
jgi:hypothetical protein